MLFACNRHIATTATVLFYSLPLAINAMTITGPPTPTSTIPLPPKIPNATCEFRTINYITDSLPQLCLKSSWSNSNNVSSQTVTQNANTGQAQPADAQTTITAHVPQPGENESRNAADGKNQHADSSATSEVSSSSSLSPDATASDTEGNKEGEGELSDASFLSFEDWKKQTLDKADQQHANIGNRRSNGGLENKKRDAESFQNNLDSFGDEGEIDLDFAAFRAKEEVSQTRETQKSGAQDEADPKKGSVRRRGQYRSKDAGVTCKERFSYSSFDAGATILKTHPGAKNSKAVLIENKDSYMLSECAAENKFLIVELSEDIWIDTLVLANYEFFSSMIRTFRVSVSDRYPVKHWHDLGVLEARNSREIQAFLIENPRIWARYLRLEFLSHYGNEYYCPLSLIRVHGTRMIENWKEEERADEEEEEETNAQEEDESIKSPGQQARSSGEETITSVEIQSAPTSIEELVEKATSIAPGNVSSAPNSTHRKDTSEGFEASMASEQQMLTPWSYADANPDILFSPALWKMCLLDEGPVRTSTKAGSKGITSPTILPNVSIVDGGTSSTTLTTSQDSPHASTKEPIKSQQGSASMTSETHNTARSVSDSPESSASISGANKSENPTTSQKQKTMTSTSSSSPSLPTIQESFFKAVSRRLQLLEANSTLSLKYIEEQSKILREAFTKVEKKQLQKTTTFLENLNSTVLAELRGFRQQYDEIWQSTVISLESQREESRREILAISARLNILADEVVFQKRMSIVQACLLLLCLGLVIFSRVSVSGGHLDFQGMQSRSRIFLRTPLDSPPNSPEYHRVQSLGTSREWTGGEHRRQRSDDSAGSRSPSGDDSPPTPYSNYSKLEHYQFPESGGDEQQPRVDRANSFQQSDGPSASRVSKQDLQVWEEEDGSHDETLLSPSSARTPKSRLGHFPPMATPPLDDSMDEYPFDPNHRNHEESRQGIDFTSAQSHGDWANDEQYTSISDRSPPLLSPSPEHTQRGFSIARKPLPALPPDEA